MESRSLFSSMSSIKLMARAFEYPIDSSTRNSSSPRFSKITTVYWGLWNIRLIYFFPFQIAARCSLSVPPSAASLKSIFIIRDNNSEKVKSNNVIINIDHRFMNMQVFVFPCIGTGTDQQQNSN